MQEATGSLEQAKPPCPQEGWLWHERLKRWYAPGTSPVNGNVPPLAQRFKPGVSDPRQSKGGILSAQARAALEANAADVDRIVRRWIRDAQRGDNRAREQLLDRLEGKVEQSIRAELTSRYVIEEAGTPYVDAGHTLTVAASDNIHYVAQCAGDSVVAPMNDEPKSGGRGADPDAVTPPHREPPPKGAPRPFPLPA